MTATTFDELTPDGVALNWQDQDVEQWLHFRGGRFTQVNTFLSLLVALACTLAVYGVLLLFAESAISVKLIGGGPIPYSIVLFTCWALSILFLKWRKLALQKKCLRLRIIPDEPDFVLSPRTVDRVNARMLELVDEPKSFTLFNRIAFALSNLRNIGRVSDVDEILRSQAESDEAATETSYVLLSGLIWAIPILGFIGTVLGLSVAIGEFGSVLSASTGGTESILPALQRVTGGLGVAFDTTLEALVAALVVQLLTTFLKKSEQEFLDGCAEYCSKNIVSHLRLLPYEQEEE